MRLIRKINSALEIIDIIKLHHYESIKKLYQLNRCNYIINHKLFNIRNSYLERFNPSNKPS